MAKKKSIKRIPLGKPLPPASDAELSADSMREWANNEGLVHAQKYGDATLNGLLAATVEDVTIA